MNRLEHIRLLLLEDDCEDAQIFRRFVSRLSHYSVTVDHAVAADKAWERMQDGWPDIVFVDLNLAGAGSGLDFLAQLGSQTEAPPVVVVTGSGDEEKAVESMQSGAADYIVKGRLSSELLERTIRTVFEKVSMQRRERRMVQKLAELSVMDDLTSVANRRHLTVELEKEARRADRTGRQFALLMIDLDNFKSVNDRYGHQAGDDMLRRCARGFVDALRSTDFVARYGGDEFCIILPETDLAGARRVSRKLRRAVRDIAQPATTASIGIAVRQPDTPASETLRQADAALYEAKRRGRDCVVGADEPGADRVPCGVETARK
jgi:diguanylate cyclase (GGDEF)-like protein